MRKEITEAQITELMQAIPRAEEVDRLREQVDRLRADNERLRAELDVEQLRLAACNVVAMADTPERAIEARKMKPDYRSATLSRVERRVDEVIALRAEVDRQRAEIERLRKVYVLIATESAGIVEGGSIFEDKIAGCYASHQSADKAGENLGYVNWRIEEHTIISNELEGKP